jgi:hypothetical protein
MITRSGFISNSSSTSFFCQICERKEELLGDVIPIENDMFCCEKGHEFHIKCLPDGIRLTIEELEEIENPNCIPEKYCPICNLEIIPDYILVEYIEITSDLDMYRREIKERFNDLEDLREYCRRNAN